MERRVTRTAVVQALYQIDIMDEKDLEKIFAEFIEERNSLVEFDTQNEQLSELDAYDNTSLDDLDVKLDLNSDIKPDIKNDHPSIDLTPMNTEMFKNIIQGVVDNFDDIDQKISEFIAANWAYERVERVLKAIIRAGVYELLYIKTPDRVVFNEYIEVAKYFYTAKKDIGFVNGILNKINVCYGKKKKTPKVKVSDIVKD